MYEAIINSMLEKLIGALQSDTNVFESQDEDSIRQYYDRIVDAIISNREELEILIKRDQGVLMMRLAKAISAGSEESMDAFTSRKRSPGNSLNAAFLSAGIVGVIYEWFTHPGITDDMAKEFLLKTNEENRNIYKLAL